MRATMIDTHRITMGPSHAAFTSLCQWREYWYCAYRVALHHGITPPGHVAIRRGIQGMVTPTALVWPDDTTTLCHSVGDCRDPRLVPTAEALWLFCGVYLPDPRHQHFNGLSAVGSNNLLVTHVSHTTDGVTWAPLEPILRPNVWAWSAIMDDRMWWVASYAVGLGTDIGMTITLSAGPSPYALMHYATIYDGHAYEREGTRLRYPNLAPCEPVLWSPCPQTLACAVRTGTGMDIGISRHPYTDWRWHASRMLLHPSAVLQTRHGTLLAARMVTQAPPPRTQRSVAAPASSPPQWHQILAVLPEGRHRPTNILDLPSWGDCGYAGIAPGPTPDTVCMSWYTQQNTSTLPGAQVHVATISIEA